MVMQYNKAAEQYVLLGRKRVILTEPLHVNVTRHADGLKDIYVQLRRELIRKAGDRDITIICGKREIRANKYMENGIALTKIS